MEIKEAEEFLSEEQISIIRSIVTDESGGAESTGTTSTAAQAENASVATAAAAAAATSSSPTKTEKSAAELEKWNNLKPTLR